MRSHSSRAGWAALKLVSSTPREALDDGGFVIEKNIPVPLRGRRPTYPFRNMEIGDSFVVDVPADETISTVQNRIAGAARAFRKSSGLSFRITTRKDGGGRQVRCWRIA